MLGDFEVLSKEVITEVFQSTENSFFNNLNSRIENTIDRLCKYIDDKQSPIMRRYNDYSYALFKSATSEAEKNKIRNMIAKDRSELSKGCRSTLRKYFNKSKLDTTKLYKLFIIPLIIIMKMVIAR